MFQFKQFTIRQDRTPMKVGTDGVLLGAWAATEKALTILDAGTGTGVIALMSAQRNPLARIDAIEIEPDACRQAIENIRASRWKERIQVWESALQTFSPPHLYDCIVCNPPFFINSTKTPDRGRTLARHTDSLPHEELLEHASRLLAPAGNLCVILPAENEELFLRQAGNAGLYAQHITRVHPIPGKPPKRCLLRLGRKSVDTPTEDHLTIELSRHQYSEEYIRLTHEFYLYL